MLNENKDRFSFEEIIRNVFKYKDIEFEKFKFVYWRDYGGYGKPDPIYIKGFSDFPNGLVGGKYSLLINIAKITNVDENPFSILDVYVVSKFMENNWSEMTLDFEYSEYWPHSDQADLKHLTERESKIKENIKESLQILSIFFSKYKRHD